MLGLLFVVLSYRWLSGPHPDPDGFHLALVANMIGDCGHTNLGHFSHVRRMIFEPLGLADEADFALFWDFPSLFQEPRSHSQLVLFRIGLKSSNIWYGHAHTVVWMQPSLPKGFEGNTYDESGACPAPAAATQVRFTE